MELLPNFTLLRPRSINEALAARAGSGEIRFLAGGTDLLPAMRRGLMQADVLIDLSGVTELHGITSSAAGWRIGAGVTLRELGAHADILRHYPAVATAALAVGGPSHRAVGSVGGNLCLDTRCRYFNQSQAWRSANEFCKKLGSDTCRVAPKAQRCYAAYSGDLAPSLLVHDAQVEIAGPAGSRQIPLTQLFADDGMAHLRLAQGEMLVAVHLPPPHDWVGGYEKVRTRCAIDFALVGVAVALRHEAGQLRALRIAVTGTDSSPMLIEGLEALCLLPPEQAIEQMEKLMRKQIGPMDTTVAPAAYRRRVAPALARRLILRLLG